MGARSVHVMLLAVVVWSASAFACRSSRPAGEPVVFAAASTADALGDIGRDFEAGPGSHVRFSFGATRDLAQQIRDGAPVDVFVSADTVTVEGLEKDGLVASADKQVVMSNSLVIIVAAEHAPVTLRSPADLKSVARLAIWGLSSGAGNYTLAWLKNAGLWQDVEKQVTPLVDGRSVIAAVENGRADAGIVYRTDVSLSPNVRIAFDVPAGGAPAILYVAARLKRSTMPAAVRFSEYLLSADAQSTFARYGFLPPPR